MREHVENGLDRTAGEVERYNDQINVSWGSDTRSELAEGPVREIAYQLSQWVENTRAATNASSMFERGKWVSSDNVYDQMRTSRAAVKDDDIISGLAELTEALAFQGVKWECSDWNTTDCFNQMAAEQNLDGVVRKIWREEFTYGQACLGFWWDWGTFTVRGKTSDGNKRKKTYKVWFPRAVTVLDACKIVPVGLLAFGQERLVWQATRNEIGSYNAVTLGEFQDQLMTRFYTGQYVVRDQDELMELTRLKVDVNRLLLLDERYVKRHSLTHADYDRFPDIRLKSIFRLLDLKQQLMEADRVTLIGAANYILLVKKGDKDDPAYPEEITNLKANYKTLAKLPVIFSDHRLSVEIITPKQDYTLQPEKYDVLDNRIAQRVMNTFSSAGSRSGQRTDNQMTLGRPVARSMENRRHMIRRFLERELSKAVVEHPKNKGLFDDVPSMTFTPPSIQLDADAAIVNAIAAARTMNEISRESYLEYLGFDQDVEAMRRENEKDRFDDIFQTRIPFASPDGAGTPGTGTPGGTSGTSNGAGGERTPSAGGAGGRPAGGGKPKANPAKPAATKSGGTK